MEIFLTYTGRGAMWVENHCFKMIQLSSLESRLPGRVGRAQICRAWDEPEPLIFTSDLFEAG